MTSVLFGLIQWGRVEPTEPRPERPSTHGLFTPPGVSNHGRGAAADHIHHSPVVGADGRLSPRYLAQLNAEQHRIQEHMRTVKTQPTAS